MKKQPTQKNQLLSLIATRYFKSRKNPTSKDVLSAHMMTALQVWAFSKK